MNGRFASATACSVALAVALAGCTGGESLLGSSDGWVVPEIDDVPAVSAATTLPADSYRLSFEQYVAMSEAQEQRLVACAAEYGVNMEFWGEYLYKPNYPWVWGGLFGTMSAEHAREYGYFAGPGDPWKNAGGFTQRLPDTFSAYTTELGDEARATLYDVVASGPETLDLIPSEQRVEVPRNANGDPVPPGGCVQQVENEIGVPLDHDLEGELFDLVMLALEHESVVAATDTWRVCMRGATGQDFELVDGGVFYGTKDVAIADVQCTEQSRWPDYFYAVYADYQSQFIAKEPERFDAALDRERERFETLTRGMAGG